jgi:cobyrinic acid a,c-diamide synthase
MLEKRKTLGYVTAKLTANSLFGDVSTCFRGHEFHYSELIEEPTGSAGWQSVYLLTQNRGGQTRPEGYQRGNVLASYAHLNLASQPDALDMFIARLKMSAPVTD